MSIDESELRQIIEGSMSAQTAKNTQEINSMKQTINDVINPKLTDIQKSLHDLNQSWHEVMYGDKGVRRLAQDSIDLAGNNAINIKEIKKRVDSLEKYRNSIETRDLVSQHKDMYDLYQRVENPSHVLDFILKAMNYWKLLAVVVTSSWGGVIYLVLQNLADAGVI